MSKILSKKTLVLVGLFALLSSFLGTTAEAAGCYGSYKDNKTGEIVACQ